MVYNNNGAGGEIEVKTSGATNGSECASLVCSVAL